MTPLELEHHVQRIITEQEQNGVSFNIRRAKFYKYVLQEKQIRLYSEIRPSLKPEVQAPFNVPVSKPFLKTGGYGSQVRRWFEDSEIQSVSGPFTRVLFAEPDLGKRQKLIDQLLRLGWVPKAYTPKGSPKITVDSEVCPSLSGILSEIGQKIAEWYTYRHRESQITGLLERVRRDQKLSAGGITIGTPTYRFRHTVVVNVPRPSTLFGHELRSLFWVPDREYRMVGHDAKGLELRMLAHYINDPLFTREVVQGDIHTKNQRDAGLPTRDDAKTFIYAFIYGGGDEKIGSIIRSNRAGGRRIKDRFLKANPKLADLIKRVQRNGKRGYLIGIDGRKIILRRDRETKEVQVHKALNTLLQSAGAIVMKYSMYFLDKFVKEMGLDVTKVIDMHDEAQAVVHIKDIPIYEALCKQSLKQAGEYLGLNVPLEADTKVGLNWAQTH